MKKIILASVLIAFATATANAATYVWWTLEPGSTPWAYASQQGTPDGGIPSPTNRPKPLIVWTSDMPGSYNLNLAMWIASDEANTTQGCTAYRTNLWTNDNTVTNGGPYGPNGIHDGTPENLNPMAWTGASGSSINTAVPESNPTAWKLLDNFGRLRWSDEAPIRAPVKVTQFTLHIELGLFGYYVHNLYQTVGNGIFGTAPVTRNTVYFGSNPGVSGGTSVDTWADAAATIPVIEVHPTPEPATLVLLGLGLLGLRRRR